MKSKTSTKPVRYASYLRCSTDDQAHGDFTTIDAQRAHNRVYIQKMIEDDALKGIVSEFVGEWADEGKTGTNLRRAGWKALADLAERKGVDVVVVTYMSRLARGKAYHVADYLLTEQNVRVEMVQEKFSDDVAGHMTKEITIFADGIYPKQVSQWVRTKQAAMVAQGFHLGGQRVFGYTAETEPGAKPLVLPSGRVKNPPRRLVPNEEEAAHVRCAFQLVAETGNTGNAQRYLREVAPVRKWDMNAVRLLLTNDRYKGVQRFGDNVNLAAHPAIVSAALWDAAQARMERAEREPIEGAKAAPRSLGYIKEARAVDLPYYLRGRVFCEHCQTRMTPGGAWGHGGKIGYYLCVQNVKAGKRAACPTGRVNAAMLHELVVGEIARAGNHPTVLEDLIRTAVRALPATDDARAELERVTRNAQGTKRKIARLVDAIKNGLSSRAINLEISEMETLLQNQEQAIVETKARIEMGTARRPDAARVSRLWAGLADEWAAMTIDERTELFGYLVHSITMEQKRIGVLHLNLFGGKEQNPLEKLQFGTASWA